MFFGDEGLEESGTNCSALWGERGEETTSAQERGDNSHSAWDTLGLQTSLMRVARDVRVNGDDGGLERVARRRGG